MPNLFRNALGYQGPVSSNNLFSSAVHCEDDLYGCCTTPAGPTLPNISYNRPITQIQKLTPQQRHSEFRKTQVAQSSLSSLSNNKPKTPSPPHYWGPHYMGQDAVGVL